MESFKDLVREAEQYGALRGFKFYSQKGKGAHLKCTYKDGKIRSFRKS